MKYSSGEKYEIIRMVESSDLSVRRTLQQIDISKSTFYDWYGRYCEDGIEGLKDRKRTAKQFWNAIPESEKDKIVDVALQFPEKSCREIAFSITDQEGYFVSESSVYRILKAKNLIPEPVYAVISAKDAFQHPTSRIHELWQTDFTYFKILCWGWYYLSTIMDDYSRYILAWKLCSSMTAEDVKATMDLAIEKTGVNNVRLKRRPRLLSDNGPCYISSSLRDYLEQNNLTHTRGRPFHPMTQGKIERYHRSMKNIILLDKYYSPSELEYQIEKWVEYYNDQRYHEAIGNVTPKDKYLGLESKIFTRRAQIKERTMNNRLQQYRQKQLAHCEVVSNPV